MKNPYKYLPYLIIVILFTLLMIVIAKPALWGSKYIFDQSTILKNIEKIGNLSVIRMNFQSVLDPTVSHTFFGLFELPFMESKALVVIKSEAEGCIDLTKVKKEHITVSEEEITIKLPEPYVCHTKINLNETKTYDVNLIAKVFNPDLPDLAKQNAEKNISEEALKMGILDLAKTNAESILTPIFTQLTNKKINFEFDK